MFKLLKTNEMRGQESGVYEIFAKSGEVRFLQSGKIFPKSYIDPDNKLMALWATLGGLNYNSTNQSIRTHINTDKPNRVFPLAKNKTTFL